MAFNNNGYFNAKIDGVDVYSIRSKINYNIDSYEGRVECVNRALEYGDNFYNEYFEKYCKSELSLDDNLMSDNNVVQSLEAMANYLLAKDPEPNKAEEPYFVNEQKLTRNMVREDEFDGTSKSRMEDFESEFDSGEVRSNQNFKKLKRQKICSEDLKRNDELGEVLRDYDTFLQLISRYTKKNNDEGLRVKHPIGMKAQRTVYTKHQGSVKDDMIIVKDSLMKTHGYNLKNFSESTQPDYSVIDLSNVDHLLGGWVEYDSGRVMSNGLLSFKATNDYQDDFNCIIISLENLIAQCELSEFQLEVLELYQGGMTIKAISDEFKVHHTKVERSLKNIAKKVSERALHLGQN